MPTYTYKCTRVGCLKDFEFKQKMADDPITECPACKNTTLRRVISTTSFQLKGGGWEKDGYNKPKADK